MESVAGCLVRLGGVERYLGVDLLANFPGRLQSLEGGAVFEALQCELLIDPLGRELLCSLWGPLRGRALNRDLLFGEPAGGVAGEGDLLAVLAWGEGTGVDLYLPAPLLFRGGDGELQLQLAIFSEQDRCLDRQLLQGGTTQL